MIRFVLDPNDVVVPDIEGRLPGRGAWVIADRDALATAVRKNAFSRVYRRPVAVDQAIGALVSARLTRHCLDLVGLARRAGQAVAGFEKVREALKADRVAILLAASDGSEDGRGKLRALARSRPVVEIFDSASLGRSLGRDMAVHAAIAPGRLADRLLIAVKRLEGVLGVAEGEGETGFEVGLAPAGQRK